MDKTGAEAIPCETTSTEEPDAVFTKVVSQDTSNNPSAIHAYASVNVQKVRNVIIIVYAICRTNLILWIKSSRISQILIKL